MNNRQKLQAVIDGFEKHIAFLKELMNQLPEESVPSSETLNDEEDDTGGGNHPGKPHNP